jgi:hypothetical protein
MIHPQYIIAYIDCNKCKFIIKQRGPNLDFEICFYSLDIKILYMIKRRFKSGKIIKLNEQYVLKINKQLTTILEFIYNNKPLSIIGNINFYRFSYLYQKLYINKKQEKSEKEIKKIKKRMQYFGAKYE